TAWRMRNGRLVADMRVLSHHRPTRNRNVRCTPEPTPRGEHRANPSVAVVLRLERPARVDTAVRGPLVGELGQLHAEGAEVQLGDLLVEVLGQHVDADRVALLVLEQ